MIVGIQFGTAFLALAAATTGISAPVASMIGTDAVAITTRHEAPLEQEQLIDSYRNIPTEVKIRNYFADIPILAAVARCESQLTHETRAGVTLRGIENPKDVGVMQINESYHGERSEKLGYNIFTLEGNLAYARNLYEEFGLSPWSASKRCWIPHLTRV